MRLDHINIRAPSELIREVKDFYGGVFGLEDGARPDFGGSGHWLYAEDQAVIHLSVGGDLLPEPGRGYLDHVAFRHSGARAFAARLEEKGIEFRSSYISELDLTQLFFSDPAGNGLEVNFAGERL